MRGRLGCLWAAVCLFLFCAGALAEENLIQNGGFEEMQNGLPAGWDTSMWQAGVSELTIQEGGLNGNVCATVVNNAANDARFVQTVAVEPNTVYRLGGWVKAAGLNGSEGGAGFSVLGTRTQFPRAYDTGDEWVYLECYVTTGDTQTSLQVAARLGFYGQDTLGRAQFDNVSLKKAEGVPEGASSILLAGGFADSGKADTKVEQEAGTGEKAPSNTASKILAAGIAVLLFARGRMWRRARSGAGREKRLASRLGALEEKTPPLRLEKGDWALMLALTLVSGLLAFAGLGAVKAPQTGYTTTAQGETLLFDLKESRAFQMMYYGGINRKDHLFSVSASLDGIKWQPAVTAQLLPGNCFQWQYVLSPKEDSSAADAPMAFEGRYVRITADGLYMSLMEVAFQTADGKAVPATAVAAAGAEPGTDPALLTDEQDTAPEFPSYFNSMYFDEIYHGRTAYEHEHGLQTYEWTHPPLGKVLMMLAIRLFGMTPFGWRFAGALAGVLMVPAMYLAGRILFHKKRYAFLAAFLMTFDLLHLAQTRLATIDSFVVLFILISTLCMFRYLQMSFYRDGYKTLMPLCLSGLFMGLACAVKWTGMYAGLGLALLFFWSLYRRGMERLAARRSGDEAALQRTDAFGKHTLFTLAACIVFFVLIPFAIYYASYIPQFAWEGGLTMRRFIDMQEAMFDYHANLTATHGYQSPWYEWPLMLRPMWYYRGEHVPDGMVSTIMGMGNPLIWWPGALAILYVFLRWFMPFYRGQENSDKRPAMLLIAAAAQFVPWIFITRATFIYHYFACLVFVMLCIVYAFEQIAKKRKKGELPLLLAYMALVLAAFAGFYPFATGIPMARSWADAMNWLKGLNLPWWKFGGWLRY